ncbi:MAG TPA: hypothetical protein VF989_11300 [Polyangiaceae bacterium]
MKRDRVRVVWLMAPVLCAVAAHACAADEKQSEDSAGGAAGASSSAGEGGRLPGASGAGGTTSGSAGRGGRGELEAGGGAGEASAGAAGESAGGAGGQVTFESDVTVQGVPCTSVDDCSLVTTSGFPGLSDDGQRIAVSFEATNRSLRVRTIDVDTGEAGDEIELFSFDELETAREEVYTSGTTEIDDMVAERARQAQTLLDAGRFRPMTPLDGAGLGALYDDHAEELVVRECHSEDCPYVATEADPVLLRIPFEPIVSETFGGDTCTAAVLQPASGAADIEARALLLIPSLATEDLCPVNPVFVTGRY